MTYTDIYRNKRLAAGCCVQCGTPNESEFTRCDMCREKQREYSRRPERKAGVLEYLKRPEVKAHLLSHRPEKNERNLEYMHNKRVNDRLEVLQHYSGNVTPFCACCGELLYEFLSIDHINGDGAEHRREIGGPQNLYRWLIKHNFPEGHRVLCMNCNHSMGLYGYCPHEKEQ